MVEESCLLMVLSHVFKDHNDSKKRVTLRYPLFFILHAFKSLQFNNLQVIFFHEIEVSVLERRIVFELVVDLTTDPHVANSCDFEEWNLVRYVMSIGQYYHRRLFYPNFVLEAHKIPIEIS
jgi:hypothetical protein